MWSRTGSTPWRSWSRGLRFFLDSKQRFQDFAILIRSCHSAFSCRKNRFERFSSQRILLNSLLKREKVFRALDLLRLMSLKLPVERHNSDKESNFIIRQKFDTINFRIRQPRSTAQSTMSSASNTLSNLLDLFTLFCQPESSQSSFKVITTKQFKISTNSILNLIKVLKDSFFLPFADSLVIVHLLKIYKIIDLLPHGSVSGWKQ